MQDWETKLNWDSLKKIIAGDIDICRHVQRILADDPAAISRQDARIEALRNVLASMETLEGTNDAAEAERIGEMFMEAAAEYARNEAE